MTVTEPHDEPHDEPTEASTDREPVNSLPPVVPEDEDARPVPTASVETDEAAAVPPSAATDEAVPAADAAGGEPDEDAARQREQPHPEQPEPSEPSDDEDPAVHQAPASGWAVLGRALRPRATRAQVLAGVLCAVLGFAVVAQVRQSGAADLGGMRQSDLVRILDETTDRGDALARESADLARERDDLLSGSDRRQAALDALRRSAETQGILTGRLPAQGPGVVVTLTEPEGYIKPITMLNMLEEMRNAGAEAIQLNDQRITASSAFTGTGGSVVLDGVALSAPYRWIAIGDPDIIAPALQIPGGAMAQVRNNGGKGTVDSADMVLVDAVRDVPDPVYATPVPPQGD